MIEVINVCKQYKHKQVLKNISFKINEGKIHGLLGPNGSGKTTTIKIMLNAIKITSGKVLINNLDHTQFLKQNMIGYVPERTRFINNISVKKYLWQIGLISGLAPTILKEYVTKIIQILNLDFAKKVPLRSLSSGMQKKVLIAQALMFNPEIIVMDEPSANLDPISRMALYEDLKLLKSMGKTIIICTHVLSELDNLADEITILYYGDVLYTGPVQGNSVGEQYCQAVSKIGDVARSLVRYVYE